ncbi:MAG: beta-ketoacyl-ACP synthase III [Bacteroidota bacterium]|nr:ketoacyl-ACP synthase III [Candidatus Kapabacteria bacterium]MDW8219724.1 beta-ketoacyl-ACP synthase III [Bacteroidota bacterium]
MKRAVITAVGHYVPDNVIPNSYFENRIETTDEWIRTRTGIEERRFAPDGMATSDMGVRAIQDCLNSRGIDKDEIDFIIVATVTPDYIFPSTACIIQDKMQMKHPYIWGYDVSAACSGFIFALETARRLVEAGASQKALVVGADKMTTITDPQDRTTCIIFGDGAGAVLLEPSDDENTGIIDSVMHIDGSGLPLLHMKAGGSVMPASLETVEKRLHYIFQDGQPVFRAAVKSMADAACDVMQRNNLTGEDIAWLVPHQANLRIIDATASRMELEKDRVMINIQRYGNTTAGTIPICLSEWHKDGKIKYGDNIILAAFGGGFTYGATYLRWGIRHSA